MLRLVLVALAILAVGGFADPVKNLPPKFVPPHKVADKVFLKKQVDLLGLYYHILEPVFDHELKTISETWSLDKNLNNYKNVTAVKIYLDLTEYKRVLPRGLPFSVLNTIHLFEAKTLFNILYSSKDYDTFYKTALYLRDRVNENLFVYVLGIATLNYPETQGILLPPLYEVFPSYFHNGQIMTTAQRLNTHGKRLIDQYPGTFLWEDNIVIKWNETVWPYYYKDFSVSYFTNDYHLNSLYYNNHIIYPFWLSGTSTFSKYKRGEYFWFFHKQLLTRYYMERLSNGLGEIPELDYDTVEQGYESGLLYHNGIPFPSRPNYFSLDQPMFTDYLKKVRDVESRIRSAVDLGYVIDQNGKYVSIRTPEAIDLLGKLIEGNVDSPNYHFYQSIVNLWKILLGNSLRSPVQHVNGLIPLVVPSALEQYQTTLRDPAFYMIWKRVLKFFNAWSAYLPRYTFKELSMPSVKIERVEIDKLVTYFENVYTNITNHLHLSEKEIKDESDDTIVLVQHAVLNHKSFNIRLLVKSDVAKTVVVRFFMAPKYDSKGVKIPLHENTQNFFLMDQFVYELPVGESVITRESGKNVYMIDQWTPAFKVFEKAFKAYKGQGEFILDDTELFDGYPRRLTIPKGRVGGMPFVFMAYINEYVAPKDPYGTGANPPNTFDLGTGSHRMTNYPLGFPLDRPLYEYQVEKLDNMFFQDVNIYHKPTPEMYNPFL